MNTCSMKLFSYIWGNFHVIWLNFGKLGHYYKKNLSPSKICCHFLSWLKLAESIFMLSVPVLNCYLHSWASYRLFLYSKMTAIVTFILELWSNICLKVLPFWENREKQIFSFAPPEIGFLRFSRKVSVLEHMLLHKLYINVAIANILLYWKSL